MLNRFFGEKIESIVNHLRFDEFILPFIRHLHARSQQYKVRGDMRGLLSDTERKIVESISYFHGEDRQRLQKFIGQSDWDDEQERDFVHL